MDDLKSIAVPVTRRKAAAPAPARRRGRPSPPIAESAAPTGRAGPMPAIRGPGPGSAAPAHRYHVGQRLEMTGGGNNWSRARSLCRVLFLMPAEGGSPLRYRVRSDAETFDRIIDQSDLALPR